MAKKASIGENGLYERITKLSAAQFAQQRTWRRHFHQYPELSNREFATTKFLRETVRKLGLRLIPLDMPTGLLAEVRGKGKGPTVAIRTDIDALPILEQNNIPYKSKHPGVMHACGHDMHVATVLGAAKLLTQLKDSFPGTVRFIFQPAEEMPPGGARPMIKNGALENVSLILGLHVDPAHAVNSIGLRDGVTMASLYDFDVVIHGHGGHAARPHLAGDAIVAASEVIDACQKIVSRDIDPIDSIVITFGTIQGGTARNVIADMVKLQGTARTLSPVNQKKVPTLLKRVIDGACRARGVQYEIKRMAEYPVLKNEPSANRLLAYNYRMLFPKGQIHTTERVMGGEDFACYLEQVPGAMFRLGVMNKVIKATEPWHSARFMADEAALQTGSALLAASAIDFIQGARR